MDARYRKEIERLYLQMYSMLFQYAKSVLSSPSQAEEAVQDTFRIACQKPEALCESPNPEGWLVKTLKYVLANAMHTQASSQRILQRYSAHTEMDRPSDQRMALEVLYEDLAQEEAFRLLKALAVEGKSYPEVAREQHISLVACRKRVERARRFLREKLST